MITPGNGFENAVTFDLESCRSAAERGQCAKGEVDQSGTKYHSGHMERSSVNKTMGNVC